jgi:hypothetical protein
MVMVRDIPWCPVEVVGMEVEVSAAARAEAARAAGGLVSAADKAAGAAFLLTLAADIPSVAGWIDAAVAAASALVRSAHRADRAISAVASATAGIDGIERHTALDAARDARAALRAARGARQYISTARRAVLSGNLAAALAAARSAHAAACAAYGHAGDACRIRRIFR